MYLTILIQCILYVIKKLTWNNTNTTQICRTISTLKILETAKFLLYYCIFSHINIVLNAYSRFAFVTGLTSRSVMIFNFYVNTAIYLLSFAGQNCLFLFYPFAANSMHCISEFISSIYFLVMHLVAFLVIGDDYTGCQKYHSHATLMSREN